LDKLNRLLKRNPVGQYCFDRHRALSFDMVDLHRSLVLSHLGDITERDDLPGRCRDR